MTARLLEGRPLASEMKAALLPTVERLRADRVIPALRIVLAGEDTDSAIYVRRLRRHAADLGVEIDLRCLPATVDQAKLNREVVEAGEDDGVDGILVPMPLPAGLSPAPIINVMDPDKDVDGLTVVNAGRLYVGEPGGVPSVAAAIIALIEAAGAPVEGARALVVGRSIVVGKPVAHLLLALNATVTIAHSRTLDLAGLGRESDILVAAAGRPGLVTADMVKPGAVVIDAGINQVGAEIAGDVDFVAVSRVAGAITPVPGGVGPLTNVVLLRRVVENAARRLARK
ncbi:MAG TPA: tetrahydrofolate dehydrogenase/cyclohydrolase catalytic domain-containing protein [Chloroflexota bacterium]|nr:tetrahydrofolate dehydrogenase/cyclohydrolase catalytic domain-containing protein [Chloroflexota bacterium]